MKESKIFSGQNLTEKVHYVYRVIIDGKYYIGKRTGLLNDLETGRYKTSSNLVHEKLQNGHHFSKIKILKVFSTSEDALEFESRILTRLNAKTHPKFLNQSNGDKNFYIKQHTEKTKEKIKEYFNTETEEGRKNLEKRSELSKAQYDINTEEGRKRRENHSEKMKEYFNPETEEGRKQREKMSKNQKTRYDINTEQGRKQRENKSQSTQAQFDPNTEEGRKQRENHSKKIKEYYKTEQGRKRREDMSNEKKEYFNPETEEGRKRRENKSQSAKAQFDKNTEEGRQRRENKSQSAKAQFDPNTEEGRKRRENHSKKMKEYYNPKTEEGKERLERAKVVNQKVAKTRVQNRKNASILGELMFDEAFIKENFLIIDDKNNSRFLWSVYSKLTGYSYSHISKEKQNGKLSFLSGIKSIALTEEQESVKIEEIKAIIKKCKL